MSEYKADPEIVKGHTLGYISKYDIDKTSMPANAVTDCLNMDFYEDGDRRRPPYDVYLDLSSQLTGYTILKYHFKTFYDKNGNEKECVIVAAKLTASPYTVKLFIKGYYNPASGYDNYNGGTEGFSTDFVELTERVTGITWGSYGSYVFRFADIVNTQEDYYTGWFGVLDNGTTRTIWRMVTKSINAGGYTMITVTGIDLPSGYTLADLKELVRFPITELNNSNWNAIAEVSFLDNDSSSLKIMFGEKSNMLWLGMIQDRNYFRKYTETFTYPALHLTDWLDPYGAWSINELTSYTIRTVTSTSGGSYFITIYWSKVGMAERYLGIYNVGLTDISLVNVNVFLENGLYVNVGNKEGGTRKTWKEFSLAGSTLGTNSGTIDITPSGWIKWDGFWFTYDDFEIKNKKPYLFRDALNGSTSMTFLKEEFNLSLGINYSFVTPSAGDTNLERYDRAYSLVVELDGYQSIFIKQFLCNGKFFLTSCTVNIENTFDRRISAFVTFFKEFPEWVNPDTTKDKVIPATYLLDNGENGYAEVTKLHCTYDTGIYSSILFQDAPKQARDTKWYSKLETAATGLPLNSYLNEYYYADHIYRAKNGISISSGTILFGIKRPLTDISKQISDTTNNQSIVVFSQLQQAGVDCNSLFSTERIRQVAREKILGLSALAGADFLIFTKRKVYWRSIQAQVSCLLKDEGEYETFGLISEKGLAAATKTLNAPIGTVQKDFGAKNFKGLYYVGYNAILGFMGEEPKSISEYRWEKEFNTLTDVQKSAIISGYNSATEEIWFYVPAKSRIYIWNIFGKHWKKYYVSDTPQNFLSASDNRMTWNDNTKIYKMERDKYLPADIRQDKTTVTVDFYIEKFLNHKNTSQWKIPDKYELMYDIVTLYSYAIYSTGSIKVTLTDHKGVQFNYDMTSTPNAYKIHTLIEDANIFKLPIKHKIRKRVHTKWYKMKIESVSATAGDIVSFRINGIINTALLTAGKIIETK